MAPLHTVTHTHTGTHKHLFSEQSPVLLRRTSRRLRVSHCMQMSIFIGCTVLSDDLASVKSGSKEVQANRCPAALAHSAIHHRYILKHLESKMNQQNNWILTLRGESSCCSSTSKFQCLFCSKESQLAQALSNSSDWCLRHSKEAAAKGHLEEEVHDLKL